MTITKWMVTGFLSLSMAMVHASSGGFQLDRSRIVFQDGKTSVSYGVTNHYDSPALASLNFAQGYLQKKKLVFTGNKGQNLPDFGLYY